MIKRQASAGKTGEISGAGAAWVVYPRERGEDYYRSLIWSIGRGLPPRARGRLFPHHQVHHIKRFTPASAGKTNAGKLAAGSFAVYPRERGEDISEHSCTAIVCGLPPRARGRPSATKLQVSTIRFTPASAGKTVL